MSALRYAIDKLGGVAECARICGISPRGVYKWLQRDALPRTEYTGETQHARRMAEASQGAFTAEWLLDKAGPTSDFHPTSPDADPAPAEQACTDNQEEPGYPKRQPGARVTTTARLG